MTKRSVLLAGLLATACGTAQDIEHSSLDGTWLLRGATVAQSCAGQSLQFPFSPQAVEIETNASGMTVASPLTGSFTYGGSADTFTRETPLSDGRGDAVLTSTWRIAAVSQTMLSAALTYEVRGADEACVVHFAVSGVRP